MLDPLATVCGMDLISQVTLLGGVCDRATLIRLRSAREVDGALRAGVLVRDARGRYSLPTTGPALRTANRVAGVLSHRSAAQYWGWAQKSPPKRPDVTFPRERQVDRGLRSLLVPHWSNLGSDDVRGLVTTPERTLIDCMRNLPLDESIPIVNSAIRADDITPTLLRELAEGTRGRGRQRIRDVADASSGKCANQFEAVLFAQALLVPGLNVVPQHPVLVPGSRTVLHPDLADPVKLIAVEAEGFEWHGNPVQLTRDCRRYNILTLLGWLVIRFSWRLVMFEPAYVHQVLVAIAQTAQQHANVARRGDERFLRNDYDIRMSGGPLLIPPPARPYPPPARTA